MIEKDQRLSASILWQLQAAFYQQSGITAWNQGAVPYYITNNPYIAAAYARVIQGFLRDHPNLDPQHPVYILELGAGPGQFAYYFLHHLRTILEGTRLAGLRFVYLLTDLAESNVNFWKQHPLYQAHLQAGRLDMARFDPLTDDQIHLVYSGQVLSAVDLVNPLIVLANYFLDSLPADLFSVHQGMLCEEQVTLTSTAPALDPNDPAIMSSLEVDFRPRLTSPQYYHRPEYNRLLQSYLNSLEGSYVLFPTGALDSLERLLALSEGRMIFLTADKGEHRLEALRSPLQPEISVHGRGISMIVNFHALDTFLAARGGQAFHSKHRDEGLDITAYLVEDPPLDGAETRGTFHAAIEAASPDDFFVLKKAFEPHYASSTLDQLLAFLRLSGYDPQIFKSMAPYLLDQAPGADPRQQERLFEAAGEVCKLYYPIGEPFDLLLALARIYIALSAYPEALDCLRLSQVYRGPTRETDALIAQIQPLVWD
ncbi:MAG: SAM-dependent methyltransferase [Anaerolineaceae bacterium]|nr:SAM-dependent methyltransferase [Anaerolineaceae bacterium]